MKLATVAKFLTAVVGAAAEAANAGLLPANIARWVGIGIAVATALGVYAVPNTQAGPAGEVEALALQVAQHLHLLGTTPAGTGATSPAPVPAAPPAPPTQPPPAAVTEGPH